MSLILKILIIFLSTFAAFIPMVLFLLVIWWMDRHLRQPLWMVAAVFLWGAFGAILIGAFGSGVLEIPIARVFGYEASNAIGAVFIAPFLEEIAKGCILLLLAFRLDFNNMADGIVFGAAAGLGFGMTENFLYFTQVYNQSGFHAWLENIYVRTFYSAVMHCVSTATLGMSLGFAKSRQSKNGALIVLTGLAAAMGLHAFWNTCMVVGGGLRSGLIMQIGFTLLPMLVVVLLIVYQVALYLEGRMIWEELQEESAIGTIPPAHVEILTSYFKRNQKGWYPFGPDQNQYIAAAMTLASKRHQWKTARGRRRRRLEKALTDLRNQLLALSR